MKYEDIKDITNAEAVAYYSPLTERYIPCADLENLLGYAGLANRNAVSGAWEGSLIDFMNSNAVPALTAGLEELFSHLNKPRSIGCDTHEQPWASKMADLLAGLEAVAQIDAVFSADVVALGDGYLYPGLDEAFVESVRVDGAAAETELAAKEAQEAADAANLSKVMDARRDYNSKFNEHVSHVLDNPQSTDADIKLAVEALAASYGA